MYVTAQTGLPCLRRIAWPVPCFVQGLQPFRKARAWVLSMYSQVYTPIVIVSGVVYVYVSIELTESEMLHGMCRGVGVGDR